MGGSGPLDPGLAKMETKESQKEKKNLSVESNSWTKSSAEIEIARLKCISNHSASSAEKNVQIGVRGERIFMATDLCLSLAIMSKQKLNDLLNY